MYYKIILYILFLTFSLSSRAKEALTLESASTIYPLGDHLSYLEDKKGILTINDVSKTEMQSKYKHAGKDGVNFGYTDSVYWFKMTVKNESNVGNWLIKFSNPLLCDVTVYKLGSDLKYKAENYGYTIPYNKRAIESRYVTVPVENITSREQTLYFRISSFNSFIVNADMYTWHSFLSAEKQEQMLHFLFYGLLVAMCIYNGFIAISTKSNAYRWYVVYVASMATLHISLNGFLPEFLPMLSVNAMQNVGIISTILTLFSAGFFTIVFLRLSKTFPKLSMAIKGIVFLLLTCIPLGLFISYQKIISVIFFSIPVLCCIGIYAAIMRTLQKFRPAYFYLASWIILVIGAILLIFSLLAIIPSNVFTSYATQFGCSLEVLLLAFALGDRMNLDRMENERLQKVELQKQLIEKDLAAEQAASREQKIYLEKMLENARIKSDLEGKSKELEFQKQQIINMLSIADRLNSPLTTLRSTHESVVSLLGQLSSEPEKLKRILSRLQLMDAAMSKIDTVSSELAIFRESEIALDAKNISLENALLSIPPK